MMRQKRHNRMKSLSGVLLPALLLCAVLLSACGGGRDEPTGWRIPNDEQVVAALRKALREHSREFTVRFSYDRDVLSELPALAGDWVERALQETDDPAEGDYIRYQYGGYEIKSSCRPEGERYDYEVHIQPRYYTYLSQEQEVSERVEALLAELGFDEDTADFEKIRCIYDYVRGTVRYDRVHSGRSEHTLRSTAYSALHWHAATCQGYCVTLYRLLREAGVPCRVVTGTADGTFHAWNLVELDGAWYGLDATWDAGREEPLWFLKGSEGFSGHEPGPAFENTAFRQQHPMSPEDYAV